MTTTPVPSVDSSQVFFGSDEGSPFGHICKTGQLDAVQRYVQEYDITPSSFTAPHSKTIPYFIIGDACAGGNLEVINWLLDWSGVDARIAGNEPFVRACENGQTHVAEWLTNQFSLTAEDAGDGGWLGKKPNHPFLQACRGGHLKTAQWLVTRFGDAVASPVKALVLSTRHPDVVAWLVEHFYHKEDDGSETAAFARAHQDDLNPTQAVYLDCENHHLTAKAIYAAFIFACEVDNLLSARWLAERFPDMQCDRALEAACQWNDVEFVQWLALARNARCDVGVALECACDAGNVDVARWLMSLEGGLAWRKRFTLADIVGVACACGHLAMVEWLLTQNVDATALERNTAIDIYLARACQSGNMQLILWLVQRFEIHTEDVRANHDAAFRKACKWHRVEAAQYLVCFADLTAEDLRANDDELLKYAMMDVAVVLWLGDRYNMRETIYSLGEKLGIVERDGEDVFLSSLSEKRYQTTMQTKR